MKNLLIASVLAVTALGASAQTVNQETYGQTGPTFKSTLTRTEVVADLRAAQASGTIAFGEHSAVASAPAPSDLSRAQVKHEALMLRQAGRFPATGEISGV